MQRYFFILILFCANTIFANEKEISVTSKIDEVTIYRQGAQVKRQATASLSNGTSQLIFKNLPSHIDPNQINLRGSGDFTILEISHKINVDTLSGWDSAIKNNEFYAEITKLQAEINHENGFLSIYDKEEQMLAANQTFSHKENGIEVEKLKAAADFIRQRYLEIRIARLEIAEKVKSIQSKIQAIETKRAALDPVKTETSLNLIVRVKAQKSVSAKFDLTYQVNSAGWYPSYDARVESIEEPMVLDYQAFVYQNTGEDWKNIDLVVSTGTPQQNAQKPTLNPWYIYPNNSQTFRGGSAGSSSNAWLQQQGYNPNVQNVSGQLFDENGQPLIGATVMIPGTSYGATTDLNGYYNLTVPQGYSTIQYSYLGFDAAAFNISNSVMNVNLNNSNLYLDEIVVTESKSIRADEDFNDDLDLAYKFADVAVEYTPTQTKFKIDATYNIPSDGKHHSVQVQSLELDADYLYQCAPKIDPTAYLMAQVTGWEDYSLLAGSMNIYFEDTYVGKAQLNFKNVEDTLNISLGADPNIIVQRKRIKAENKKQVIAGKNKITREWQITVRNNKRSKINIQIEDQIPISTNQDIEVELEASSGGDLNDETGKVTWDFTLNPSKKKTLNLKYEVRFPKEQQLVFE